jgi:hypothetical protein
MWAAGCREGFDSVPAMQKDAETLSEFLEG